ncbi:hypothetical protein ABK730_18990 [Klebsiella indica]|uniref:hypothetical protein n=1 Tax=Klebsiella TaxID=570 RepID=UPI003753B51B
MSKVPKGSIERGRKEPVIENISRLIDRYPSRSAAARAWGFNLNTLNSYFKNKEVPPIPRRSQLLKIASVEGVTIDWLLHENTDFTKNNTNKGGAGINEAQSMPSTQEGNEAPIYNGDRKLLALFEFLSEEEKLKIAEILARKGVETALLLLDEDMLKIAHAHPTVKKTAVLLSALPDARVREILAEVERSEHAQLERLTRNTG